MAKFSFRLSESVLLSFGQVSWQRKAQPLAFQLGLFLRRFNRFAVDKNSAEAPMAPQPSQILLSWRKDDPAISTASAPHRALARAVRLGLLWFVALVFRGILGFIFRCLVALVF